MRIGGVDGNPSPNGGEVTPVGLLGVSNMTGFVGMDIFADGTAYVGITQNLLPSPVRGNPFLTSLFTVDLSTGTATSLGLIGGVGPGLAGLAAIPEPGTTAALGLAGLALCVRRRR